MQKYYIWCDGACKGNPGVGGWGALIIENDVENRIYGGQLVATNNQMELKAAIMGLCALAQTQRNWVTITTDSQYVKKGITEWINGWKRNGWRTSTGSEVKNKPLWVQLDALCQQHEVHWKWVKGHSGDKNNDIVDELANQGVQSVK